MIASNRPYLAIVIGFWCLAAAVVAIAFVVLLADGRAKERQALQLSQAVAEGQVVELPTTWRGRFGTRRDRSFAFDLTLDELPDTNLFVHFPFFEQRLRLKLNGGDVYDSAQVRPWVGPVSSLTALALLPPEKLVPGVNRLEVIVSSGPRPPGALFPIRVGTRAELEPIYLFRKFLNESLPPVIYGIQLFLAFAGLMFFAYRPEDAIFGWLGLLMVSVTAIAAGSFSNMFPLVRPVTSFNIAPVPMACAGLLGFTRMMAGSPSPRYLPHVAVVLVLGLMVAVTMDVPTGLIGFRVVIPMIAISGLASLYFLIRALILNPRVEFILFALGLVIMAVGTFHDVRMRMGHYSDAIWVAQVSRIFVLTAIAIFIVRHQSGVAVALDNASRDLADKLRQKEAELQQIYEAEQRRAQQRTKEEERQRITADLHDGVAGHLATIVALSDSTGDQTGPIRVSAKNALLDLRMVIDALNVPDGNLMFFLGLFRDRCVEPLANLGIEIDWSMAALPDTGVIQRNDALSIIRILQEAVNNALRHGHLQKLTFRGRAAGQDHLEIVVVNQSLPLSSEEAPTDGSGIGLISMKTRAEGLGGQFDFTLQEDGARVVLTLPNRIG